MSTNQMFLFHYVGNSTNSEVSGISKRTHRSKMEEKGEERGAQGNWKEM